MCTIPRRGSSRLAETLPLRAALPGLLGPLRAHARALCRDATLADDLVQETILRALRGEAGFVPGSSARAWLFMILRNLWLEGLRRRKREMGEPSLAEPRQAEAQSGHMELRALRDAMALLPPGQREALLLVGAQGMSMAEAAEICGVPEGTIKARLSRGRAGLRRWLAGSPTAG